MASTDERVSRLEGTLEQMNERLGNMEGSLRELRSEVRWVVGLIIVQWVTVLAAVLGALLSR